MCVCVGKWAAMNRPFFLAEQGKPNYAKRMKEREEEGRKENARERQNGFLITMCHTNAREKRRGPARVSCGVWYPPSSQTKRKKQEAMSSPTFVPALPWLVFPPPSPPRSHGGVQCGCSTVACKCDRPKPEIGAPQGTRDVTRRDHVQPSPSPIVETQLTVHSLDNFDTSSLCRVCLVRTTQAQTCALWVESAGRRWVGRGVVRAPP